MRPNDPRSKEEEKKTHTQSTNQTKPTDNKNPWSHSETSKKAENFTAFAQKSLNGV